MKALGWYSLPLVIFAILGFFLWRGLALEPQKLPSVQLGKSLPNFKLPSLDQAKIFSPESMRGGLVLLNVWASWCEACVEEHEFLMRLARESLPIYGLNYKDSAENARGWLKNLGNPYQLIGEDREGRVAIDLGVYGVPETFLIDKKGIIRYRHVGKLDKKVWKRDFLPLIQQLQGEA